MVLLFRFLESNLKDVKKVKEAEKGTILYVFVVTITTEKAIRLQTQADTNSCIIPYALDRNLHRGIVCTVRGFSPTFPASMRRLPCPFLRAKQRLPSKRKLVD